MSYLYYNVLNEEKENFTHITVYIYCSFIWALPRHFEEALFLKFLNTLIYLNSIIKNQPVFVISVNQPVFVISVYKRKFKFLSLKSKTKL